MRIFLDANILFSAAKADGAIRRLLHLLRSAGHECWVDGYVLEEARRNLAAKASAGLPTLESLLPTLRISEAHPADPGASLPARLVEKDRPVLAAAIHLRCEALVTGDRTHFGEFYGRMIGGVRIYSPRSLAEELL